MQLLRLFAFGLAGMLKVAGGGLLGFGCTLLWLLLPLQRRVSPAAKTPVVPTLAVMALAIIGTLAFFAGHASPSA